MTFSRTSYYFSLIALISCTTPSIAFEVEMADSQWTGEKVPKNQQCQKFGGSPQSPSFNVSNIPEGTQFITMEYGDLDNPPMSNGGHGVVAYAVNKPQTELHIPSFNGHSFDLPLGFFIIQPHSNPAWDKAGAYMPPCSGGGGHMYVVKITANTLKDGKLNTLGESLLNLGRY